MLQTSFSHSSSSPLPPAVQLSDAIKILHDFETVIKFSPDTRGCKPIDPPNGCYKQDNSNPMTYYEVEDDLPFIPKRLWSGGVKYKADFQPQPDGCDITVHAPGGFISINHWRIVRDTVSDGSRPKLERKQTKDLLHAEADTSGGGWYVQIVSDAECNRVFAGFVKGFLTNAHGHLRSAFIETLKGYWGGGQQSGRRPTLGRRRSSRF